MERKYHKYKAKYLSLKQQRGGKMPGPPAPVSALSAAAPIFVPAAVGAPVSTLSAAAPVFTPSPTVEERIITNIFDDLEKIRNTIDWFGQYGKDDFFDKEPPMIVEKTKDSGQLRDIVVYKGQNLQFYLYEINNNIYQAIIPLTVYRYPMTWESLKSAEDITNNLLIPIGPDITRHIIDFSRFPSWPGQVEYFKYNENDKSPRITIRNLFRSYRKIPRWPTWEPKFKGSVIGEKEPSKITYPEKYEYERQLYLFSEKIPLSEYLKAVREVEARLKKTLKEMLSKITAESRSIVPTAVEDITWSYLG
ncbi:MAG: hypothetical protein Harvfovirus37_5 [Harvfovirus sp.]|uniref:Uncharacterized protein n=1 Tax=Harvfovirus sp. TaxID=2487768 RepID=A0A3G5A5H7_9VIRU|nr:MAG: hypothetical protein Harvfovirus37_5 [Harvfovirus sp.]